MNMDEKLKQVCEAFCIPGTYLRNRLIRNGNINKTYQVTVLLPEGYEKSFLVQNVNTYVFKNPIQVMENIDKVTEHVRKKCTDKKSLHFHHTADRKAYWEDGENFWRLTNYIPSATYDITDNMQIICNAGKAFGEFQTQLADFSIEQLFETIPNFHNTCARYQYLDSLVSADPLGKVAEVQPELEFLFSVRDLACKLSELQRQGILPTRVTHNDTKINNVLFSLDGTEALTVVDLDTVMPGLVGHDFGDAIRFAANYVEEDCPDSEKAGINMDVFRAFTEGFLEKTAKTLTVEEVQTLALSCFCLTCELAVRFLGDYIEGSPYFKIDYPMHNLVRTRCQITLAKDIYRHLDEMNQCVHDCYCAALH